MALAGDVVEDDAAVAVHALDHCARRALGRQDDGYPVLDAEVQVSLLPGIGWVDHQVNCKGGRVLAIGRCLCQRSHDLQEPGLEHFGTACGMCGKAAHQPFAAGRDHQRRRGHQKHRCNDHRYG